LWVEPELWVEAERVSLTGELKAYARASGFHLVGVTSPAPFPQAELDITQWLSEGHQGEMAWLNAARTHLATRPAELLPDARSLIVVGVSYRTVEPDADPAPISGDTSSAKVGGLGVADETVQRATHQSVAADRTRQAESEAPHRPNQGPVQRSRATGSVAHVALESFGGAPSVAHSVQQSFDRTPSVAHTVPRSSEPPHSTEHAVPRNGERAHSTEPAVPQDSEASPPADHGLAAAPGGRIARYAWGDDYHDALKRRLQLLAGFLAERSGREVRSRVFVDSGPLVERDAAVRAGLGFRGKNTNLLTSIGSFVFLGAILTDVDLEFDQPVVKDCGNCRLCIDACPTDALDQAYHLAAERCIAYLTIEHRGPIDVELRPKLGDWVFGCDICQEVCPYNASTRGRPRGWPEFEPRQGTRVDLTRTLALDDQAFRDTYRGSPVKRAKRAGLVRNAATVLGNQADPAARPALEAAATTDPSPMVRDAAEWALSRLH
jgi:epoxyqueuosine reductase